MCSGTTRRIKINEPIYQFYLRHNDACGEQQYLLLTYYSRTVVVYVLFHNNYPVEDFLDSYSVSSQMIQPICMYRKAIEYLCTCVYHSRPIDSTRPPTNVRSLSILLIVHVLQSVLWPGIESGCSGADNLPVLWLLQNCDRALPLAVAVAVAVALAELT